MMDTIIGYEVNDDGNGRTYLVGLTEYGDTKLVGVFDSLKDVELWFDKLDRGEQG